MSSFFDAFPKIDYDMGLSGLPVSATNIMLRFRVREIVLKYTQVMLDYIVKDGEKPFIVADKYYGRPELSELILLTNNVVDPYFDWPLASNEFSEFLIKKYGSVEASTQRTHSLWMIVQQGSMLYDGTIIPERLVRVDQATYSTLTAENRKRVYCYDYETDLNEGKRKISLIKKNYVPQIEEELKTILK